MNSIEQGLMIKGCLMGISSAQKKLYDRYSGEMFKVCLMYAHDYDQASDLLQEGFLKVFQNLHKYESHGRLGGWIRRLVVNVCIDHYRSDKWVKNRQGLDELGDHKLEIADTFDPGKIYERDDFLRVIKGLPEGYSVILNLYFLEDMGHAEIAGKLGITVGTSKSQLFKAKRYLKKLLVNNLSKEEIEVYEGRAKKVV
jgi:RNA polymerase sigma-70 factor (ECF subfamily)